MQVKGLAGSNSPVSFDYKTSLLRQRLGDYALVLNPDAMAVMVAETLHKGQTTNHYYFGENINALTGIDHPFSSFPIWAGTKRSAQTRLFNRVPTNHLEMVELLRVHGDPADVAEYARRALVIDPSMAETEELLKIAISDQTTDQALAFLQKGKTISPPLPKWHCFYQNYMEVRRPGHDLQTEYALLCKAHPDMPGFYYLLGRVARSRASAKLLFEKSEQGSGSHGMGYHAIAYDLLCSGQFKAAQPYSKKALEKSSGHPEFKEVEKQIHLALRQYEPLLQHVQANLEADPSNDKWGAEKVKYLTLLGEHTAATEAINNFPKTSNNKNACFLAARFYVSGNVAGYLENLLASGAENASLQQFLHAGKVEAAHSLFGKNKSHEYTAHLILYCAAEYHGHSKIAETELAKTIAELGQSTSIRKEVASILSSETPPPLGSCSTFA